MSFFFLEVMNKNSTPSVFASVNGTIKEFLAIRGQWKQAGTTTLKYCRFWFALHQLLKEISDSTAAKCSTTFSNPQLCLSAVWGF